MEAFIYIMSIVCGLVLGSFFNVAGLRIPLRQPFALGHSRCPHCGRRIPWYDLIPVVSYLILRGKCRFCHHPVSYLYPLIELSTGMLFFLTFHHLPWDFRLLGALSLISMLMIVVVSDIRYLRIPNAVLVFFTPFLLITRFLYAPGDIFTPVMLVMVAIGIVVLVIYISKGGMGMGDLKLFAVIALLMEVPETILLLFLSCIIGGVAGLMLLLLKVIGRRDPVPFAPAIAAGAILSFLYGDAILTWYGASSVIWMASIGI